MVSASPAAYLQALIRVGSIREVQLVSQGRDRSRTENLYRGEMDFSIAERNAEVAQKTRANSSTDRFGLDAQ